jgi:hypothetical protein
LVRVFVLFWQPAFAAGVGENVEAIGSNQYFRRFL